MDIYNLIILLLIIVLIFIFMRKDKHKNQENFSNMDENTFGNLIYFDNKNVDPNEITFKENYYITGFKVEKGKNNSINNKYTFKINDNLVSIKNNTAFKLGKYYDISDLNIKAKNISFTIGTPNYNLKYYVYGLSENNILNKEQYNSLEPIPIEINDDSTKIKFQQGIEHMVSYIKLGSQSTKQISKQISLEYKNSFTPEFEKINGIKDFDYNYYKNSNFIYFDEPILMNELIVNAPIFVNNGINKTVVYGRVATSGDKKKFELREKIKEEDENNTVLIDNRKCPALSEIKQRQRLINDLCNSLSEKDKIRNQQNNYEKTKRYISRLKRQEEEIETLKAKLSKIITENDKTSLSFDEKVGNIQSLIDSIKPFDNVIINNTDNN